MQDVINNPAISYRAGTAITKFRLATVDANGDANFCGATDVPYGQTMDDVAAGALQGLRLLTAGTLCLTASKDIAKDAPVYTTAAGKITDVPVADCRLVGIAVEAAAADGDLIKVLPIQAVAIVVQELADLTYAAPEAGAVNSGDAGTDTVITSLRTQLIALAADVAALRANMIASQTAVSA